MQKMTKQISSISSSRYTTINNSRNNLFLSFTGSRRSAAASSSVMMIYPYPFSTNCHQMTLQQILDKAIEICEEGKQSQDCDEDEQQSSSSSSNRRQ
jgi:hypothetical protein